MKLPSVTTLFNKLTKEPLLGWAQLSHQKVRMIVALSGIAFADILIFMQLGFYTSLFGGITRIHEHLNGDLFLVSARAKTLIDGQTFSRRHLYQAAAVDGIASANPFYYSNAGWINPWEKKVTNVAILAFDPAHPVLDLPEVNQQLEQIKLPDKVLVDRLARPDLGPIAETLSKENQLRQRYRSAELALGGCLLWVVPSGLKDI